MIENQKHKAPRVHLRENVQKVLAAITYVIAKAEARNTRVSQYDILKTIFLADKAHLNEYGRPVTFDNYVAMRAGPVASLSYDFLKENEAKLRKHHIPTTPWDRESGPSGRYYYSKANLIPYEGVLSESDKNALSNAWNVVKSLTFGQIKRLTHNDPAYIEAWEQDKNRGSFKMSYGMLFDSPDFEQAEAVEYLSKHM
ncbi:MAG: Panacea domain-containing protein [Kiloniellales bacterium]